MFAEIITIGDEILIGQIVDTNSAFISKALNKAGVRVYQITSVQDDRVHILDALNDAMTRADVVLVTGGLGPTKDDITKQTFCEFLGDTLVESEAVRDHINYLFSKYFNRKPLPENLSQALVPSTAEVLTNPYGTAPGMWMRKEDTVFVSMPGVPYEMKHLLTAEVIPRIIRDFERPFVYHKTLLTYGMGESSIANRICKWEDALPDEVKLAYLPSFGRVRLRLSSTGPYEADVRTAVDTQMATLHEMLSDIAIGYENETSIELQIGELLVQKGKTVSMAESCTGGAIAKSITANPGSSAYYRGSVIPYATELKTSILGVDSQLIEEHNVVSAPVVEAMAAQARSVFKSDYALATTGIAGPTKGDGEDEVGTVFIGLATPNTVISQRFSFGQSRERVIAKATHKALEMLLEEISKN